MVELLPITQWKFYVQKQLHVKPTTTH